MLTDNLPNWCIKSTAPAMSDEGLRHARNLSILREEIRRGKISRFGLSFRGGVSDGHQLIKRKKF